MSHAVIKAEYADYRRVKGRKVIQLVCELPIEKAPEVHRVLGEPGIGENQIWVAIALLNNDAKEAPETDKPAPEKRPQRERKPEGPFNELPYVKQAGILCTDPEFWEWLDTWRGEWRLWQKPAEESAAEWLRKECGVESRKRICESETAKRIFDNVHRRFSEWRKGRQAEQQYADNLAREA